MKHFIPATILLMALSGAGTALAFPAKDSSRGAHADAYVATISSASIFLEELEHTVAMAMDGDYGRIKGADVDRMLAAQKTIKSLLAGHDNARHLQPDERIALYNAQEAIKAIVRNDEKNRKVCKRVAGTGTRLAKAECMTVAEREARAKAVRESAWHQQHFREPPCERRPEVPAGRC